MLYSVNGSELVGIYSNCNWSSHHQGCCNLDTFSLATLQAAATMLHEFMRALAEPDNNVAELLRDSQMVTVCKDYYDMSSSW
ncbi:hypothetical protein V6N13_047751 [Hibiscus sabdariffa]